MVASIEIPEKPAVVSPSLIVCLIQVYLGHSPVYEAH